MKTKLLFGLFFLSTLFFACGPDQLSELDDQAKQEIQNGPSSDNLKLAENVKVLEDSFKTAFESKFEYTAEEGSGPITFKGMVEYAQTNFSIKVIDPDGNSVLAKSFSMARAGTTNVTPLKQEFSQVFAPKAGLWQVVFKAEKNTTTMDPFGSYRFEFSTSAQDGGNGNVGDGNHDDDGTGDDDGAHSNDSTITGNMAEGTYTSAFDETTLVVNVPQGDAALTFEGMVEYANTSFSLKVIDPKGNTVYARSFAQMSFGQTNPKSIELNKVLQRETGEWKVVFVAKKISNLVDPSGSYKLEIKY